MGVVKSPHFSGNFSYNTPFLTDNGFFHINICRDMHILNTLYILWSLSKNRFCGLPKTDSVYSDCLTIESDQQFAVEFDGEVIAAVEEERFDRVKHGIGYPYKAINYCLEEGGISLEDLDYIAFNFKPFKKYRQDLWLNLQALFHGFKSIKYPIYLGTTAIYPYLLNFIYIQSLASLRTLIKSCATFTQSGIQQQ